MSATVLPLQSEQDWLLTPRLKRGQELVYRGKYTEEAMDRRVYNTRAYEIEARVFVLETSPQESQAVLYTSLRLLRRQAHNAPLPPREPRSVRLELVHVASDGEIRSAWDHSLAAPLDGPASIECGQFVQVPKHRVRIDDSWETAEENRPPRSWMVIGVETIDGTTCVKLMGLQQSADWMRPRADRTAWRRIDTVWLSSRFGIAQRVKRVIERRDPARTEPTQRFVVEYDLESNLVYPGKLYDDRFHEIAHYRRLAKAAEPYLREPNKKFANIYDGLAQKIQYQIDHYPPTPYRPALLSLQAHLQAARDGKYVPYQPASAVTKAVVGQIAPDFMVPILYAVNNKQRRFRLHRHFGQPILLVFYRTDSEKAHAILRFAQNAQRRFEKKIAVIALAVADEELSVLNDTHGVRLTIPVLLGNSLRHLYDLEATPKMFVLDKEGIIRHHYVGWGKEIPHEIMAELERWSD